MTKTATDWHDPDLSILKNYRPPAPAFPTHLLGGFWGEWVKKSAVSKSAPVDYIAATLLTSAGALIGNAYAVSPWESWVEPAAFWSCCIGNPSSGKTPAINAVMDLMRSLEKDANADFMSRNLDYESNKKVAAEVKKKWEEDTQSAISAGQEPPSMPPSALEPEKPAKRRILAMDATVEIIAPLLLQNPKGLLLFRDELAGWLGSFGQYKGGGASDRSFYLESYNAGSYTVDRVKFGADGSLSIPHLTLSLLGGIQVEKFGRELVRDNDDGLTARFCYFFPEAKAPETPTVFPDTKEALRYLEKLQQLDPACEAESSNKESWHPHILKCDSAFSEEFKKFRDETYEEEQLSQGHYLSYLGKNNGRVLRLGLILEFLTWAAGDDFIPPTQVSAESLRNALALVREYLSPMAQRAFEGIAPSKKMQNAIKVAKWFCREKSETVTLRDIKKSPLRGLPQEAANGAITELEEAGWLRLDPSGERTGGRPSERYLVNPKVLEATS